MKTPKWILQTTNLSAIFLTRVAFKPVHDHEYLPWPSYCILVYRLTHLYQFVFSTFWFVFWPSKKACEIKFDFVIFKHWYWIRFCSLHPWFKKYIAEITTQILRFNIKGHFYVNWVDFTNFEMKCTWFSEILTLQLKL